ncbi:MAG: DNA gyrase inhibitor YacG [Terriglobia bacterium]
MRCPICHQDVSWEGNSYRPFCSERCKLIDLDHWLSERYRISTPVEGQDEDRGTGEMEQDDKDGSG